MTTSDWPSWGPLTDSGRVLVGVAAALSGALLLVAWAVADDGGRDADAGRARIDGPALTCAGAAR